MDRFILLQYKRTGKSLLVATSLDLMNTAGGALPELTLTEP